MELLCFFKLAEEVIDARPAARSAYCCFSSSTSFAVACNWSVMRHMKHVERKQRE